MFERSEAIYQSLRFLRSVDSNVSLADALDADASTRLSLRRFHYRGESRIDFVEIYHAIMSNPHSAAGS